MSDRDYKQSAQRGIPRITGAAFAILYGALVMYWVQGCYSVSAALPGPQQTAHVAGIGGHSAATGVPAAFSVGMWLGFLLGTALQFFLVVKAHAGRNWARHTLAALFSVAVLSWLSESHRADMGFRAQAQGWLLAVRLLGDCATLIGLVLLYVRSSNTWYRLAGESQRTMSARSVVNGVVRCRACGGRIAERRRRAQPDATNCGKCLLRSATMRSTARG